ncbi:hypothetical protein EYF80_012418 [Liparis tanakae]|uniref:Uncharacterized protein n=1 Tax=Liparis tanakae TaxID=230148 RepID=A0A4Z2IIN9_9TELE|nr:hypothetical protein EYF80_012418 [Liparis tanakae]
METYYSVSPCTSFTQSFCSLSEGQLSGSSSMLAAGKTANSCWKGMKGFSRSKVNFNPDMFLMSDKNGA